jgi:hypothetical protein
MSRSVKVFLLPFDGTQSFFYADGDNDAAPPSTRPGLRGWFERTMHHLKSSLKHPKGRLARKLRQAWDWMQQRMHPDEPLLAALRTAPAIEVYYRASMPGDEVRALWYGYLGRRWRRHLPWLLFNALLSPLSVLLTPLPGPNVIGYWFAYRAIHHLLIVLGIRRALSGRVETTFHPVAGLEAVGGCSDDEWRARAATQYQLKGLHDFVKRIASGPSAATLTTTDPGVSGGTQASCDC